MMKPTWTIDGEHIAACRGHISLEHLKQHVKNHKDRKYLCLNIGKFSISLKGDGVGRQVLRDGDFQLAFNITSPRINKLVDRAAS